MTEPNFSAYSDSQVIDFLVENPSVFTEHIALDFPKGLYAAMRGENILFLKRKEGFAVAFKKQMSKCHPQRACATLEFLYVDKRHIRKGLGALLVEDVKKSIAPTRSLELTCEGEERKLIFEKMGFQTAFFDSECNSYAMYWTPPANNP